MINISIDEKDKHVLRVTASYFLALAGDISAEIVKDEKPTLTARVVTEYAELTQQSLVDSKHDLQNGGKLINDNGTLVAVMPNGHRFTRETQTVFNETELNETFTPAPDANDPAVLFAKTPAAAPFTAGAEASPTAPVDTPAITSIPTPPNVPSPPAALPQNTVEPAVPPTASPAANVELDVRGLPWDARIHSRTKSKLANGEWKVARNTDPALVTQVEAELRNLTQIVQPIVDSGIGYSAPAHIVPPNPANDVVIVPPGALTLPDFMRKVSELITAGRLPQPTFIAILNSHGLASTTDIMGNQDKLPAINASVDEFINGATQ